MDNVMKYYQSFDEWGRLDREPVEFIVNMAHIQRYLPSRGRIADIGAGPGKYALALARAGHEVTLIDLVPRLVEQARSKAAELQLERQFAGFHVADARDLHEWPDDHFDACLLLGPLYHLQNEEDRIRAVSEVNRITKKEGFIFAAFMTRIRHFTTSLLYPEAWKPNHTIEGIDSFLASGIFNHTDEGRFTGAYFFDIERISPFMQSSGFECVKLIGSGSIAGGMTVDQWDYWRKQGPDVYRKVIERMIEAAENPYILGASSHVMYIGRKKEATLKA
ncbi:class I SAM-dependent methyltransferase [Paenibacillus mendelii]|uniref:Class I SAM-dependent methyltransferase n=1 Tax=Paenibacillus mendelii TaxID=206163 RepID=A0ABV6JBY2_9BACL|nr:class I SAM-dependent methyltransferase [Paenibacillus mendelii]MCQ6562684.1 class I SAM-dependent methyltransferase [Paenibacillus mendelii]